MKLDKDTSAVVCGGASGMGAATVRALRDSRVKVAILDLNEELGRKVAAETGATFFKIDVLDEDSVVRGFAAARAQQGQERILVCTPGGGGMGYTAWRDAKTGEIRRHDFARFSRIVALNLNGTFLCASVASAGMMSLPVVAEEERGIIILTSSTTSEDAPARICAYAAAKAGINAMMLSMARDLAPEGIRVNAILPGSFDTPLIADLPEDFKTHMRNWNLLPKRFGKAEEYASLALELVRNAYINASIIRIDGGARAT